MRSGFEIVQVDPTSLVTAVLDDDGNVTVTRDGGKTWYVPSYTPCPCCGSPIETARTEVPAPARKSHA